MTILKNSKNVKKCNSTVVNVDGQVPVAVDESGTDTTVTGGVAAAVGTTAGRWASVGRALYVLATTALVLMLSLTAGMACGRLYRHFVLSRYDSSCPRHAATSCSISVPFNPARLPFLRPELEAYGASDARTIFRQDVDIDIESRRYEVMVVPHRERRPVTFVHDFLANVTVIVDAKNERCFALPLNACRIATPVVLFDLVHRTMHGYQLPDLPVADDNYHVALPPISSARLRSCPVAERCAGKPVYMLARCPRQTSKELPEEFRFAEYAGPGILVYSIENYKMLERFEGDFASD